MIDLPYRDREDAGRQLADALSHLSGRHPLVLAIPRGGVPVARVVADALAAELDVVLVRKLGAPGNPELAIGAIDERGTVQLQAYAEQLGADADYVRQVALAESARIRERRLRYGQGRRVPDIRGRTVIVVDDGLATGATMGAALDAVRRESPLHLVCAVPVASRDSLAALATQADEIVCPARLSSFQAVGAYYRRFPQVDDADVEALLGVSPDPKR